MLSFDPVISLIGFCIKEIIIYQNFEQIMNIERKMDHKN